MIGFAYGIVGLIPMAIIALLAHLPVMQDFVNWPRRRTIPIVLLFIAMQFAAIVYIAYVSGQL